MSLAKTIQLEGFKSFRTIANSVSEASLVKQISKLTASSKDSVRNGLAAAGIATRQHGRHHGHPSQPQFGKRIQKGRETDFKAEQKVVGVIRELRDQKMTLRQIGQALTKLGVQTKCRGQGWHPEMVRRVLATANATLATSATLLSELPVPNQAFIPRPQLEDHLPTA